MKKIVFGIFTLISLNVWSVTDWTKAQVIKVEPQRHRIVLQHEPIKSIGMEGMTMSFDAAPQLDLKSYKAGDLVRFQVKIKDGALEVMALEKTP
jgi:Cu/Ag efflux protein CusF